MVLYLFHLIDGQSTHWSVFQTHFKDFITTILVNANAKKIYEEGWKKNIDSSKVISCCHFVGKFFTHGSEKDQS